MPRIGTQTGREDRPRRRKRPAPRPRPAPPPRPYHFVGHSRPPAPPRIPTRPAPRLPPAPPAPRPRPTGRAPAFRPPVSQARPFRVQQTRARARTRRARKRLGDPRYASRPTPPPPRFRLNPQQIGRAPAFRPIGSQARPFRVQQTRAATNVNRARRRLPDHPAIPEVKGLYLQHDLDQLDAAYKRARLRAARGDVGGARREYNQAVRRLERQTPDELIGRIRDAYKAAARSLGGRSIMDLYEFGSLRQRRQMRQVARLIEGIEGQEREQAAAFRGIPIGRDRVAPLQRRTVLAGTLPVGDIAHSVTRFLDERTRLPNNRDVSLADFAAIVPNLTRATVEDPAGTARSSVRTALESITGIPMGVKTLIDDPGKALSAMAEDYERRYGPIFNNPAEFRRRVQQESGLTPFVLDAASLGVPVGRAATVLMRSGPAGRAVAALGRVADSNGRLRALSDFASATHRAARAPRDARRLAGLRDRLSLARLEGDTEEIARVQRELRHAEANARATERPALRFSGGEGGVRKQGTSPNLFIALGQRALDRSRRRAYSARVARAGMEEGPGERLVTVRGRKVKRMTALRPGEREVVPKTTGVLGRSLRELPGARRYTGRIARDLGEQQSVTRIRLLTHRGRVLNRVDRAMRRLDDDEQSALKYMLQLGATPDQAGVRLLERRRAQIEAARAEHRTRIASVLEDSNDELALINRILDEPTRFLTPRSREVADELRELQLQEARRDPELTAEQELIRRVTPQGAAIGVTRGPDVEFFRDVLRGIGEREVRDRAGNVIEPAMPEVAAFADELAELMPADRGARAAELRQRVARQYVGERRRVGTAERRLAVSRGQIRTAEQRGRPIETEGTRAARADLAAAKRDRRRIGRQLTREERRAGMLLGRLSEREAKGAPLTTPEVREARGAVSVAQRRVNSLANQIAATERRAGRRIGEASGRETRRRNERALEAELDAMQLERDLDVAREDLRDAQRKLADVEKNAPRLTRAQLERAMEVETGTAGRAGELAAAERRVQAARDRLAEELAAAPRVTQTMIDRVAIRERELAAAREQRDYVLNFARRLREVERAARSKSTMRLEDAATFADKVRAAAEAEGLAAPAYWWSSLMPREMPSLAAAGGGVRAAHRNKAYKGTLFEIGAEEHTPDVFTRGIERNIKRRFQQALVTRNLETHAYEWSRGHNGEGLTIAQIDKAMLDRAIDPRSVELVEPRILRRRGTELPGTERGRTIRDEELDAMSEDDFVTTTQQELAEGRRTWEEVSNWDRRTQALHRFVVVPREVGETINGVAARMDNTFWRAMEIVLKQKPARILLGAANIPWLAFQIASNAMLTGLGGGVNPWNIYGAHKWWRGLTPDEKEAVEAELGVTHGHHFGMDQPHLGASDNRYVNFWRAYKKSRVGRLGYRVNPLNLMFRADEAQNNFFRRVLFYDKSRKAAYRRMGASWKGIDTGISRLVDRVLARPPQQQAHLIARHGAEFEAVAKHVNNFLGDYIRFTPSERFLLQRNVMFYGYLRFSLRFVFYTMPVAHPVMANILGNIGRLGADEIKELMGVPETYALPTSILSQTYFGDRRDAKRNELRSLPLGRFNPFLNALTQLDGLQQAIGVVSPFYQIAVDQAFEESSFTGRDWRIGGRPTPSEADRPRNYFGSSLSVFKPGSPRNRIALAETLRLLYPYRVATATGIPGVVDPLAPNQSDDALLFAPQPMMYADPEASRGVGKSRREYTEEGTLRHLGEQLLPIFPRRTAAPAVIERELEREAAIRERNRRKPGERKPRRRKARNRYGGGGGSTSRYR